ncbi:MAG: hypothetical protein ACJAUV_001239 [Flavobacteriales bacterium]|jgi:uncharacterized protein YehS (DUF1456 family)
MTNNDIIKRIRYTFDYNDEQMIAIFGLAGLVTTRPEVVNWLKKEEDEYYVNLPDKRLAYFLNGLIIKHRGAQDGKIPEAESKMNNNLVLRKLKIAFTLTDDDVLEILTLVNFHFGKHELSAFFRKPGHGKYRECKDQVLRNFLHGLQIKHQEKKELL